MTGLATGCGSSSGGSASSGGSSTAGSSSDAGQGAGGGNARGLGGAAGGPIAVGGGAGSTLGAGGTGGTGGGAALDACNAYAAAVCAFVQSCELTAFEDVYGTMENCSSIRLAPCLDRFNAPGNQTTPATVTACAQSLTPTSCDAVHSACAFQGTLPNGAACAYDGQCQSQLCKVSAWEAPCGICDVPAAKGGACHQSNGCADGLQCARDSCVDVLPQGSACDKTLYECGNDLACQNGTCQPPPRLNQPCDALYTGCEPADDSECINGICQKFVWNTLGGACDAANAVLCLGNLQCNPVGGPGTCEAATPPAPTFAADCK